jgi:simple sugar transport system permease protein
VIRFEKRSAPLALEIAAPVIAALAAAALTPVALALLGYPVRSAFAVMAAGAFGSGAALSATLALSAPLMLTGLATLLSFSLRLNNLGAEGQLLGGALVVVVLGTLMTRVPAPLVIMLATLAGPLTGALMLAGPVAMKAKLGTDETIATLLLNMIALIGIAAATGTALSAIGPTGAQQTFALPAALPSSGLGMTTRIAIGLMIACFACVAAFMVTGYTVTGFVLRAIGGNPIAARFAGIPVDKVQLATGATSGALAGFAGAALALGFIGGAGGITAGLGYAGIAVALLAGRWPIAVIPAALFVAALTTGTQSLARAAGAPLALADIAIALTLVTAPAAAALTRYRIRVVRATSPATRAPPANAPTPNAT